MVVEFLHAFGPYVLDPDAHTGGLHGAVEKGVKQPGLGIPLHGIGKDEILLIVVGKVEVGRVSSVKGLAGKPDQVKH